MAKGGIQALIGDDLRDHAGVRYTELGARALLNRCNTPRMPDCWTLNPYRGCSFGCKYCYARYTHEFLGIADPEEFERRIFIKRGAAQVLASEATPRKLRARPIAIGTATDPYQPAEARYGLTREILEVLGRYRGLEVSITTKSALIVRDIELLRRLAERSRLSVNISLISLDRELTRSLDTRAPTPLRRLRTLQTLRESGIEVGLNAMPILPGLNDSEADLRSLFLAAAEHGTGWVRTSPLFLASASREHFLRWLGANHPEQLPRYRSLFARGIDVSADWRTELHQRVARVRAETGLPSGDAPGSAHSDCHTTQLNLAFAAC